ncbi:MAG: class I SAM-dependent methyltransferase [Hyphomicrobium sp.]|uniref:class I SAM-dependent methyltransferase n=1 Tax=Hyphomicrobium sp. TaxID=82 RepID=UPI0039E58DF6
MRQKIYIQYGAGASGPEAWLNFDSSPTLRAARLPLVGRLVRSPFPTTVRYGDIVQGLPVADESAAGVYASHILEHLSRQDCIAALRNSLRVLRRGGRFRLIVPNLRARAARYLAAEDDATAADQFLRTCLIGAEQSERSLSSRLRRVVGNSHHRWMWDVNSMTAALRSAGFVGIRPCELGDSGDSMFDLVEETSRFRDPELGIAECALEAFRPA